MNRAELQRLAKGRILDAKALLNARRWSGAYYLAGYAVECGLKASIIAQLMRTDRFPERKFSEQCWTHNLMQLLGLSGLSAALLADGTLDPKLKENWDTVKDWNETSRYARTPKSKAVNFYRAIADTKHGVFQWIKRYW